jgi:hypothetical protein
MTPHPPSAEAGLRSGWSRPRLSLPNAALPRPHSLGAAGRLLALAAVVLAAAVGSAFAEGWINPDPPAGASTTQGTAFLATATCADWQGAGVGKRVATIDALGMAATQPDPENLGATLGQGDAYSLFQGACSTRLSRPVLLYEIYNRAASFQAVKQGGAYSGALGH